MKTVFRLHRSGELAPHVVERDGEFDGGVGDVMGDREGRVYVVSATQIDYESATIFVDLEQQPPL